MEAGAIFSAYATEASGSAEDRGPKSVASLALRAKVNKDMLANCLLSEYQDIITG